MIVVIVYLTPVLTHKGCKTNIERFYVIIKSLITIINILIIINVYERSLTTGDGRQQIQLLTLYFISLIFLTKMASPRYPAGVRVLPGCG